MVRITKADAEFLIKHRYLKSERGRYPDLAVTMKHKKGKAKHRYVNENLVRFLPKVEFKVK